MSNLVSIIMPSYNTAQYIGDSIKSVINQTYTNWELLIIDDCSDDDSISVINNFLSDKRIHLIKNDFNHGAAFCRNLALRIAHGDWIAFLDSDDLWFSNKLELQLKFMIDNNYHFSYTNYKEINSLSEVRKALVSGPKRISKKLMYLYCWPGCLTVMYDSNYIGPLQIPEIKKNNDYAMWLKISDQSVCYLLNKTLAAYRRGRAGSISSHSIFTMIKWHYLLFRHCMHFNPLASFVFLLGNIFGGVIKKVFYVNRSLDE